MKALLRRENYASGANLQDNMDLLRLYLLTNARDQWPNPEQPPAIHELPPARDQREIVQSRTFMQALELVDAWHRERPPPLPPESPRRPLDIGRRTALEMERADAVRESQRRAFGFEVSVRPSAAGPTAGDGVFVSGSVPPGQIVLLYPGLSFEPADLLLLPGGTRAFKGNTYLMARFDKTIVDASEKSLGLVPPEALENPLTAAHLVNHPPAGTKPNVVPAAVDFDTRVPAQLVPLLPNVSYYRSSAAQRQIAMSSSDDGPRDRGSWLSDKLRVSLLLHATCTCICTHPRHMRTPITCTRRMSTPEAHADTPHAHARCACAHPHATCTCYVHMLRAHARCQMPYMPQAIMRHATCMCTDTQMSLSESSRGPEPDDGPVLKGLAFVAARELRDEELYLNYRFNPHNGYPSWYTPVDAEEDKRACTCHVHVSCACACDMCILPCTWLVSMPRGRACVPWHLHAPACRTFASIRALSVGGYHSGSACTCTCTSACGPGHKESIR